MGSTHPFPEQAPPVDKQRPAAASTSAPAGAPTATPAPTAKPSAVSTTERLLALERSLLGDGAPTQGQPPILQRLTWLESQFGATRGTVRERLHALEEAAKEQGLL